MIDLESEATDQLDGEYVERRALGEPFQTPFKTLRRHCAASAKWHAVEQTKTASGTRDYSLV